MPYRYLTQEQIEQALAKVLTAFRLCRIDTFGNFEDAYNWASLNSLSAMPYRYLHAKPTKT